MNPENPRYNSPRNPLSEELILARWLIVFCYLTLGVVILALFRLGF